MTFALDYLSDDMTTCGCACMCSKEAVKTEWKGPMHTAIPKCEDCEAGDHA